MKTTNTKTFTFHPTALLYVVFGIGLFLYLKFIINPVLYFTAQEPIFFFDNRFFQQFITYPGGLLDYLSALLSQFFINAWLGALVICAIFALIFLMTVKILKDVFKHDYTLFAFIPIAILFYAHHNYKHALVVDISLLATLMGFYLYSRFNAWPAKAVFILIFAPIFYFAAGSAFLIFCLFVIVYEILKSRHVIPTILVVLFAVILPMLSGAGLFLVRTKEAFLQPAFPNSQFATVTLVLYVSLPALLIILYFLTTLNYAFSSPKRVMAVLLIVAIFVSIPFIATKITEKKFWQITYYSRVGEWQKILAGGANPCPNTPQILALINRALYHTGQMGNALFSYSQDFGLNGLFVMDDTQLSSPLIRSDLYFDLGHYNEAKHWAFEALSVKGETVWNLQRLATVFLIYDQQKAAEVYINKLKKTIIARKWAKHFEHYIKGFARIQDDPSISPLLKNTVTEDFLSFVNDPVPDLYKLLRTNPQNKAASDYLMASLLLTKKVAQCARFVQQNYKGTKVPRLYQEALIFYVSQTQNNSINVMECVDQNTVERFHAFQIAFQANRQNEQSGKEELAANYGDTYWYYLLFYQLGRGV